MTRKTPIKHVVTSYRRGYRNVKGYIRGKGAKAVTTKKITTSYLDNMSVYDLKKGDIVNYKGHKLELGPVTTKASFSAGSGEKWIRVSSLFKNGKPILDSKTLFYWEDPDYPHPEDEQKAERAARKAGEKNPDAWIDYLEYSDSGYTFKSDGFLIYGSPTDVDIDAMPKGVSLGRIPVEDLEDRNGNKILKVK